MSSPKRCFGSGRERCGSPICVLPKGTLRNDGPSWRHNRHVDRDQAGEAAINNVFETKPVRHGPTARNEKIHEFLEREGRPEAAPIRDWIEHWYDQLPSNKQRDIRGRMRSGDDLQFTTAYFELQMFAMLKRMGCDITVEPRLADGRYNPDFLARRDDEAFYVEATVCGQGAGGLRITTNEVDAVEKVRTAFEDDKVEIHSDLWLQAEGVLDRTPSKKEVSKPFIDLMRRTTAAEVQRAYESDPFHHEHGTQHREVFEFDTWRLEGVLHPKPPGCATAYVSGPSRSACGDATEAIRASLAEKARSWRRMGPPDGILVVAMSVCHSQYFWKRGDEWNDGDETRAIAEDWTSSSLAAPWREEFKTINGILFVSDVSLGNEQATRARLRPNPERCLPKSLAPLTREHGLAKLTGFPHTSARAPSRSPERADD